jgi:hypothetical protein
MRNDWHIRELYKGVTAKWKAGRSGDLVPVKARFFTPVQTGPAAHLAFHIMGAGTIFHGLMRPGSGVYHPPPSSAEVKE